MNGQIEPRPHAASFMQEVNVVLFPYLILVSNKTAFI